MELINVRSLIPASTVFPISEVSKLRVREGKDVGVVERAPRISCLCNRCLSILVSLPQVGELIIWIRPRVDRVNSNKSRVDSETQIGEGRAMGGVQQRALGREREETGQSPSIRHSRASPDAVITASHQGGNCLHHF